MTRIAVIGTAGRDRTKPMTKALWEWMLNSARERIPAGHHLVSGGAAWADHLAVMLYLEGHAEALTLHLPAPFNGVHFIGQERSSAGAANYYHQRFSKTIDSNTLKELSWAIEKHAKVTQQPYGSHYGGMFARNALVARDAEALIAYTFGPGDVPADGGTRDTWDKCKAESKLHVPLPILR